MPADKNKQKYSFLAKLFHWGFVLLFIYGIAKQLNNIEQLEDKFFFQFEIVFALIFLILLLMRFIYMKKTQKTSLPEDTSKVQKVVARGVHLAMYSCLAGTALSGLLIGFLFWLGFKQGIIIDLVTAVHTFVINLLYWLIAIHIIAAIYHRFKKDGVWNSMTLFSKN